jgi:hypothetical protein
VIFMADPAQVVELPIVRQLLRDEPIPHLSYTAPDGPSRVPEWARLLDFETTAPSAVERLVRERNRADA